MSHATDIADKLRKAASATKQSEQIEFMRQAEELKSQQHEAAFSSGDWSAEDAVIRDTLVPGFTHELHTAATDWLVDLDDSVDPRQASQSMIAEASLWYGRVSDDVKSYPEEYTEQARNLARRLAGQYGDFADTAERTFMDEALRLRTTAVRAGIVVDASGPDNGADDIPESNKSREQKAYEAAVEHDLNHEKDGNTKSYETRADQKHSSYEDDADDEEGDKDDDSNPFKTSGARKSASFSQAGNDLFAVLAASEGNEVTGNPGTYNDDPAATSSNRAPALQELGSDSQDVVPVNDPGLGQTDDLTGANATRTGEQDHASKGSFPVHGNKKESSMGQHYASCPTCGGHGKLAVRTPELPRIEDIMKVGVSGLPQIDQTVDPHDNGPAPTPYPADVAFPWILNPQGQVPAAVGQAEQQIAQRNSLSPEQQSNSQQAAPRQSVQSAYTAGGRDNSGWIGDMGGRGLDYPGEQIGQYPVPSSADGYVDPAHGNGGDVPANKPAKPYGAAEADDYTNNPGMNWQPGQDTHADQGWREVVAQDPALQSAAAYIEQRRSSFLKNGR